MTAGADTTASVLGTFFLAMVCYPKVQKEAQVELDKVLNGRLPEHSDISSLPYLSALLEEVYRYTAVYFEHLFLHAEYQLYFPYHVGSLYCLKVDFLCFLT
jgi:Cytochrome P450